MRPIFVETGNVSRFRQAMTALEDMEKGQLGIALCWGQAGRGKTFAVQNHHAVHGGVYLRVWEDWSQHSFMQALAFEVTGQRPHGANNCKVRVVEALGAAPQTIYVDEADRLHIKRIEDLRDIHDLTGCPVVLVGEEELLGLFGERRRIWSRVTQEVRFGPVNESDVAMYAMEAAALAVPPVVCKVIVARTDGDFRLVHTMVQLLEQAAKARATDTVDETMVADVLKRRSWRRS